jgi:hypothetical protein
MGIPFNIHGIYAVGVLSLRQSGTFIILVFVFPRTARKNENEEISSTLQPQA